MSGWHLRESYNGPLGTPSLQAVLIARFFIHLADRSSYVLNVFALLQPQAKTKDMCERAGVLFFPRSFSLLYCDYTATLQEKLPTVKMTTCFNEFQVSIIREIFWSSQNVTRKRPQKK